jgi:hypothetical protein
VVNRTVSEIATDFPRHEQTERDPKKYQRRDVDWRKRALLDFSQKRFHHAGQAID